MSVMRYTVVDDKETVSFIAPWNDLKAIAAGCSRKPAPVNLVELLEAASRYDSGLQEYVLEGLKVFEEARAAGEQTEKVALSPRLEDEIRSLLSNEEAGREISLKDLKQEQQASVGKDLAHLPVLRVIDELTRQQSLEPVRIGLVIFNLPARRIIQVQNSQGVLQRSDRGRYFENGDPTDRLYFYRLPADWTLVP